jgi:purine-binding chemotaxis protein CheW
MNPTPHSQNAVSKVKTLQFVSFKLGREEFGVDILKVQEIVPLQPIARVPQTLESIAGVINLRGNVVPVIHLRKKLGLNEYEKDDKVRIIVFIVGGKFIGMLVDRVDRVLRLAENRIEKTPEVGAAKIQEYVAGIGKADSGLIILLNIEKILTEEEIISLDDLEKMKNAVMTGEVPSPVPAPSAGKHAQPGPAGPPPAAEKESPKPGPANPVKSRPGK